MPSSAITFVRDYLVTLPVLAKFALGMVMIVVIPRLSRRLHVPAAVGLLVGGVIIGPYVFGFFGVIAHPSPGTGLVGSFVASTKRRTSSTEARLAFAVLTRERKAA